MHSFRIVPKPRTKPVVPCALAMAVLVGGCNQATMSADRAQISAMVFLPSDQGVSIAARLNPRRFELPSDELPSVELASGGN